MTNQLNQTYVGLYLEHVSDLAKTLQDIKDNYFDGLAVPIVNRLYSREFTEQPCKLEHSIFSRSDLILQCKDWLDRIVSVLPHEIDCDSKDETIRKRSEELLRQELEFADHLVSSGHKMLKLPEGRSINLAKIVTRNLKGTLLIHIPITNLKSGTQSYRRDLQESDQISDTEIDDTWNRWNNFRLVTDFDPKIKLVLELTDDLPSRDQMQRWLGEPVECLIVPSHLFRLNKNSYPVLPNAKLDIVKQFIERNETYFFIKTNLENVSNSYAEYMKFLADRYHRQDIMKGLEDVLEIPLQPLFDNLDSYTYEVFEKDPVKYKMYQKAIESALVDKVPESEINSKTIVVMVVGAGRGPLVRSALNAAENTKRKIKIYIIEKNPNALITLTALKEELWPDKNITIFSKDMRDFTPPEKADILVSELLGSFGDNELSPECLDGAQKHLKQDGISIPCKSTSYLNPIMSSKVYNNVRYVCSDRTSNFRSNFKSPSSNFEFMYVVYLKNVYHIAEPKECFVFEHPNYSEIIDNSRFKTLQFKATQDCVLHGFAGYFDTVLYKDIILSIHPLTHSQGLFSWFSCFFPISEPQMLKTDSLIELNMWRCVSSQKVWYEWNLTQPKITHIHNLNGKHCGIEK